MANIFISYSHEDSDLVSPVVQLLHLNASFVFQDITGIRLGKKWQKEIDEALTKADIVIVFWCFHASCSDAIKSEWTTAIKHDKDVLPLLLDATPVPTELSEYQWIDFRATVGGNHNKEKTEAPAPESDSFFEIDTIIAGDYAMCEHSEQHSTKLRRNDRVTELHVRIADELQQEILRRLGKI
jgi:hypothetical protein